VPEIVGGRVGRKGKAGTEDKKKGWLAKRNKSDVWKGFDGLFIEKMKKCTSELHLGLRGDLRGAVSKGQQQKRKKTGARRDQKSKSKRKSCKKKGEI